MAQIQATETTDEVIQETSRIKEALAASLGFDIDRILRDAKEKQKQTGGKILSPLVHDDA